MIQNIPKTKNVFHAVKRNYIVAAKMNDYLVNNPDVSRRVGALPIEWLSNVKSYEIPDVTKQADIIFQNFAEQTKLSGSWIWQRNMPDGFAEKNKALCESLKKVLKREDISVAYVGSGALKNCHKLTVGDKPYALSIFRVDERIRVGFESYNTVGHGRGVEPQTIFLGYKRGSHGRWARPFMSTLFAEKDTNGYILSKFISENMPRKVSKKTILASREYLKNSDYNAIAGRCIEAGGNILNKKYISDRHIRANWSRFANVIDSQAELLSTPVGQKMQSKILCAKNNGVDIFSSKFIDSLSELPKAERRVTIKLLRGLKKVKDLKQELVKNNEYDTYKKLLKEDFVDNFRFALYSEEFVNHKGGYPKLLADELEVSNVPELREMIGMTSILRYYAHINYSKYYSKEEALEYIKSNYDFIRNDSILSKLKKEFKIDSEIDEFEKLYQNKISKNSSSDFDLSILLKG